MDETTPLSPARKVAWRPAHEVFDVVDHSRHTVFEMALAAARAAGGSGTVTKEPVEAARSRMGDYADCLALDQHVDAGKALRLVAWRPRHRGFVAEAEALYAAWSAHQAG